MQPSASRLILSPVSPSRVYSISWSLRYGSADSTRGRPFKAGIAPGERPGRSLAPCFGVSPSRNGRGGGHLADLGRTGRAPSGLASQVGELGGVDHRRPARVVVEVDVQVGLI